MKVTEQKLTDGRIRLDAVASPAEVNHAFTVAQYLSLQDLGIRVPQGKTAQQVAADELHIKDLDALAAPKAAQYLVPFAIDKRNLTPAFMPAEVPTGTIKRGEPFEFSVTITPKPTYELDDYSPVSVTVPPSDIPESEIDKQLVNLAESYATFVSADPHPIEETDCALIAMDAEQDGKPLPALHTEGRTYAMGMNLMPEEFERNLLGMQPGETKTFTVAMPGEGGKPGDAIEFTVTVKEVQDRKIPVIDDAWVKENFPMLPGVEGVRESLRATMKQQVEQQIDQMKMQAAASEIARRFKGGIPDVIHDATQRALVDDLRLRTKAQGMTFEQYMEQMGGQQNFSLMLALQARETLAQGYALDAVFRHERLKVTDADVAATCRAMNPQNPQIVCRDMEDNGRGFALREACERYVANKWLADHATVTVMQPDAAPVAAAAAAQGEGGEGESAVKSEEVPAPEE
ncbi:trigger factor [Adlercreutzia sp. ZJ141]|uniref:trigger factor n=1 Tax=Adlercreutzia sp. ZJ141 TaxID=2709406 RepID=UPI0013EC523F|nr:trigger factor [Adlercreutzia sp. ZJ141]